VHAAKRLSQSIAVKGGLEIREVRVSGGSDQVDGRIVDALKEQYVNLVLREREIIGHDAL
jgi:hypothetical protein